MFHGSIQPVAHPSRTPPNPVEAYIDAAPEPARTRLRALAEVIRAVAPDATERIAYGLATWHLGENLLHVGAFKHHVGLYSGSAAIVVFAEQLSAFKSSKGAVQIPHDVKLPLALVRRITRFRLRQAEQKAAKRRPVARARGAATRKGVSSLPADIAAYNAARSDAARATCAALAGHIMHPDGTRLLFWSGQSFDEPKLSPVGKFKAAEVR